MIPAVHLLSDRGEPACRANHLRPRVVLGVLPGLLVLLVLALLPVAGCGGVDADQHRTVSEHGLPEVSLGGEGGALPGTEHANHESSGHESTGHESSGHESSGDESSGHAHSAEESDLDQPVAELMAASCEHGIPTYTCDECRYEVGVARVGDELFDPDQGGALRSRDVGKGAVLEIREVPGEVVLDGNRAVTVTPLAEGTVVSVSVDLGEHVSPGQTVLELECPAFREAEAELGRATAALATAEAALAREEELFARRVCPEKDLLAARADLAAARSQRRSAVAQLLAFGLSAAEAERLAADADPGYLPVRSPISGEVLERTVARGSRVTPGEALLLLADTSTVWVMAELYEADLAAMLEGGRGRPVAAEVEVGAWPGRRFSGQVERLPGALDPATRTARARVVVDNGSGLLRPGMFATVRLLLPGAEGALMVPREAVLEDAGRSFAFVHVEGPYWVRRPVRTGALVAGQVEILEGLREGDRIVTTGAFLLKSDVLRSKMGAGCAD